MGIYEMKAANQTLKVLFAWFWLLASHAIAQPETLSIINGSKISATNSSVVQVIQKKGQDYFICTGSIISPKAILTAAHCVSKYSNNMFVIIGNKAYGVKKVKVHPNRHQGISGLIYNDIAILKLKKHTNKPRLSLLVTQEPPEDTTVSIAGYGLNEFGNVGVLREGTTTVIAVSKDFVVTEFLSEDQSNSCNGDSGGPAIYMYTDSDGIAHSGIIGTTSTGTSDDCGIGDTTFYINIQSAEVLEFIQKYAPKVNLE